MSVSSGYLQWKLQYSISPIVLTGGLATASGGAIPIVQLTNPGFGSIQTTASSVTATGPLDGGINPQLDGLFATYKVMAGGNIINNRAGTYPFANQAVAANAIIADPLTISVAMICPAGNQGGYSAKSSIMTTLQSTLALHNNMGGTYSVVTPARIYTFCILTGMRDISDAGSNQPQFMWQLDFLQPLVSQAAATAALNGLMTKLSNGSAPSGTPGFAAGSPVTNAASVGGNVPQSQIQGPPAPLGQP